MLSPIARIKIGGPKAVPLLSKWKWFSITLCTTVATGILLWGAAEPLFHLHDSPKGLNFEANSPEAAQFAMSTMFMHWTITPYSIYTLAGLLFALMYYNQKRAENISALLFPVLRKSNEGAIGVIMNILCLFALTAGMAASLGSGILSISGGLDRFTPLQSSFRFQHQAIYIFSPIRVHIRSSEGITHSGMAWINRFRCQLHTTELNARQSHRC